MRQLTDQEIQSLKNKFTYHPPKGDQQNRYILLRDTAYNLSVLICQNSEPSREQSLAITKLEECIMWTNAGIARNE